MINKVNISDVHFNLQQQNISIFDVRSPSEYAKGHIPNAINLPLFDDDERHVVGKTYKQISAYHAILKGLDIVGPKMSNIVKSVKKSTKEAKAIYIYCWRGGKRSGSVAWLLDLVGFDINVIIGGYKSYRNFVLEGFNTLNLPLVVLGGKTGSGKTGVLSYLSEQAFSMIDLEAIANHKGSAFGKVSQQPSVEYFENLLFDQIQALNISNSPIWIENESRSIGSVFIPPRMWQLMKEAPLIHIEIPFDIRLERIVEEYGTLEIEYLKQSFLNIKQKIGGALYGEAIDYLDQADLKSAAAIALNYYDKLYQYSFDNAPNQQKYVLNSDVVDAKLNAELILDFYQKNIKTITLND
ncbi:MAG: tRNA 2-selenouridine(34) synthase MnmH [Saprospiraceae bacterium]|nr:tRNA 2-selenouridine(34) synthase MnmH [Saprospiraceae bacterium]